MKRKPLAKMAPKNAVAVVAPPPVPPKRVTAWSFSRLINYEACPYRIKLQVIDKVKEPERDPETDPLARGDRVHKALELHVTEDGPLPPEAHRFEAMMGLVKDEYAKGNVAVEQAWNFDSEWNRTSDWQATWLRMKLDFCMDAGDRVIVCDYKTGKSYMKEIPHTRQTQLYAGAAALLYPKAKTIITEIWYIDEGHVKRVDYRRDMAINFLPFFEKSAKIMLNDTIFRARPNLINCRWCSYGPRAGNGACPFGV